MLHYKAEFVAAEKNTNTGEQSLEEQLYNSIILIDEDENEIEFDIMDIIRLDASMFMPDTANV